MCIDSLFGSDAEEPEVAQVAEAAKPEEANFADRDALAAARKRAVKRPDIKTSALGIKGGIGNSTFLGG